MKYTVPSVLDISLKDRLSPVLDENKKDLG
jgi:hypothetical protein